MKHFMFSLTFHSYSLRSLFLKQMNPDSSYSDFSVVGMIFIPAFVNAGLGYVLRMVGRLAAGYKQQAETQDNEYFFHPSVALN